MQNNIRCSVAMATYNGEKYIKWQLVSIINQLSDIDELIISDDGSTDNTLSIIREFQKNDKRIKLFEGPKMGVKQNFANAIDKCKGEYIFLSDQDDIWAPNKLEKVLEIFKNQHTSLVIHDCFVVNDNMDIISYSFFKSRNSKSGILKNIIKNSYIGCCMAFKSDLKKYILPIPNKIEMHDQWIGILAENFGEGSSFINDKLIKYRRHESNVSQMKHYPLNRMIKNRIVLMFYLFLR